ncbi:hypothetical protein ACHAXT_000214 [Thalassiosira profunda]
MSSLNNVTPEEVAILARIAKSGELQFMDKVKIVGLKTEKGRELNGRIGTVMTAVDRENDGTADTYVAKTPDGRYKISVEYEETRGREVRPGTISSKADFKTFSLRRENLEVVDLSPGTIARDPEGKEMLRRRGLNVTSTAEREAREPETAGFFPAIMQGDEKRVREVMEYVKKKGCPDPANALLDATGDGPLVGAIQTGHAGLVRLLLEYGADPNAKCKMPMMRELGVTYFQMAFQLYDHLKNSEDIVMALIDGGGNVHDMCPGRGTPLFNAAQIKSDHRARMRICRKLLDCGADPNQFVEIAGSGNQALVLISACGEELGKYTEEDRLELVQLLLDFGADPGLRVRLDAQGEHCNAIHVAVNRKKPDVLKVLLSCEKGRDAVNVERKQKPSYPRENCGNGETALTMAVAGPQLEQYRASRDCAVQLLKAGADPDIEDHLGLCATMWFKDPTRGDGSDVFIEGGSKKQKLGALLKKANKDDSSFWDSEEVLSYIEDGANDIQQCDNCGTSSDDKFNSGAAHPAFQRCARCRKVFYCSKACQKTRWKTHKKVCKPAGGSS